MQSMITGTKIQQKKSPPNDRTYGKELGLSKFDAGPDCFMVRSLFGDLHAANHFIKMFRDFLYGGTIKLGAYSQPFKENFHIYWKLPDAEDPDLKTVERHFTKSAISKIFIHGGRADNTWKDKDGLGWFNVLVPICFENYSDFDPENLMSADFDFNNYKHQVN